MYATLNILGKTCKITLIRGKGKREIIVYPDKYVQVNYYIEIVIIINNGTQTISRLNKYTH